MGERVTLIRGGKGLAQVSTEAVRSELERCLSDNTGAY
jgi:hypothetical protein